MKISYEIKSLLLPAILLLAVMVMFSCSTDSNDQDDFEDGISVEILELIGEDQLNIIENELEMPIHRGSNPPDIEAMLALKAVNSGITVMMSPILLLNTNVPNDEGRFEPGTQFADSYFRFSNQNSNDLTVDFARTSTALDNPYIGEGSYIIGDDDKFTVFGPLERVDNEGTVLSLNIFSGIITDGGISSPHYTLIMIDDGGVSGVIPTDTGRSFEDGDNFAEITDWPDQNSDKQAIMQYEMSNVMDAAEL